MTDTPTLSDAEFDEFYDEIDRLEDEIACLTRDLVRAEKTIETLSSLINRMTTSPEDDTP